MDQETPNPIELLHWYDRHRRVLPWRAAPGQPPDPYHVWLSEVMLQQTTVASVGPYFTRFLTLWPTIADLASASLQDVLREWAGLGYYARARNLHKCAVVITNDHGGIFPDTEAALRTLPGVGTYTAAAISAIAFERHATPVDGNFERVMARLFAVEVPLPTAKSTLRGLAESLTPTSRPGDHAQAVMDLGATVCTPRKPNCIICPWKPACAARARGIAEKLPRKAPKKRRPTRFGTAYWCMNKKAEVLLRRRPKHGMLGGMLEVPSTGWSSSDTAGSPPFEVDWRPLPGVVNHGFTHFHLELTVRAAIVDTTGDCDGEWFSLKALETVGLPSLMAKVVRHALKNLH